MQRATESNVIATAEAIASEVAPRLQAQVRWLRAGIDGSVDMLTAASAAVGLAEAALKWSQIERDCDGEL